MRFAFFGSPVFAQYVLEQLIEGGLVPSVLVCSPDALVGRKQELSAPATKHFLIEKKIDTLILQPPTKKDLASHMRAFEGCDIAVVAAYAKIIPDEILAVFAGGVIGVHPSLLPRYRGASPIQAALLAGDKTTGVSLYKVDAQVDHGPIVAQKECAIENGDMYESLEKRLAILGGGLLVEKLPSFVGGKCDLRSQDEALATFTKKFETADGEVNLATDNADHIANVIRALNPNPGVFTFINGKRTKLLRVEKEDGRWVIASILPEGKKVQSAHIIL